MTKTRPGLMINRRMFGAGLLAAPLLSGLAARAMAADFAGKTVTLVVASSPGGSFDLIGRALARHIGQHIPGNPTIVVDNMAGGRGIQAANYLYNIAPRDGTTIGMPLRTFVTQPLLDPTGVEYKAGEFGFLGSVAPDNLVIYSRKDSPVKTFEDMKAHELNLAVVGAGAEIKAMYLLMNAQLGTRIKPITGYKGLAEAQLAVERGEVDATTSGWNGLKASKGDWVRDGIINLVLQIGNRKIDDLAHVPLLSDALASDEDRRTFGFFSYAMDIASPFVAPPGLEPDVLATLQKAFIDTLTSPGFVEDAGKLGLVPAPIDAAEMGKIVTDILAIPPEVIDRIKKEAQ